MTDIRTEVTVVGGGLAGICAAVSAARQGRKVALATDRPVLGGNSSSEVRIWTRGATGGGNLLSEEMGILGEMKLRNLEVNPDGNVLFWDEVLLDTVLSEPNISLFLNTYVNTVETENNAILSVIGHQLFTEQSFRFVSEYYIDCTGDGLVAAKAGLPFSVGKEAASKYGESQAPEKASTDTMGNSIVLYTKRLDHPVKYVPPRYAYSMEKIEEIIGKGGRLVDDQQTGSDYWWLEYGGVLDTITDAQTITMELKKLLFGVWHYIKNSGRFPADNLTLEWVGAFGGKRENRRFHTDLMLIQQDLLAPSEFQDTAFYGGWYMDFHPASGVWDMEESCTQIPVRTYPVPFRALFSSAFPNLILAGRIIGVSHAAFASTRDMNTCALGGQAAGTLAAACVALAESPKEVVASHCLDMQKQLTRDDVLILGIDCRDDKDLAQKAAVTASSSIEGLCTQKTSSLLLMKPSFLTFPMKASEASTSISFFADSTEETSLHADIFTAPLPSRLNPGQLLSTEDLTLAAAAEQKVSLNIPPLATDGFVTVIFKENPVVSLLGTAYAPVGFLMGHQWSMDHLYPLMEADITGMYAPDSVQNGLHRPYTSPNVWISGEEEAPTLTLTWQRAVTAHQIRLTFDPDVSREYPSSYAERWNEHHFMAKTLGERPLMMAKAFTVEAEIDGKWETLHTCEENWQRLLVLDLPKDITMSSLRIRFATEESFRRAHLYEVRVY